GGERDGDERRAEAGQAEDERAEKRDRGEQRDVAEVDHGPRGSIKGLSSSSRPFERFIERRRFTYFGNGRSKRASSCPARRRRSSHSIRGGMPFSASTM